MPEEAAIPVPTLAIIPLDDRPCNRLFPGQLAAAGGLHVVMPPREALGWFTRPGDYESIAAWLGDVDSEHFVISVDMLCFGGLVASRAPDAPLAEALNRLEALRALRTSRPNATVFAFSTIMRLGKTVAQSGDLDGHTLLRSYSELLDRAERLGDHDASTELAAIERKLAPEVLSDYLEARRRNHAINRAAIRLAADGVIDYLALSQEDAAPIGIHIPEQLALRAQIEEFRAGDRASISQGADEVGLLLLARHCLLANNTSVGIAPDYAAEQGAEVYPAFESQPLRKTLETAISIAGARAVPPMEADPLVPGRRFSLFRRRASPNASRWLPRPVVFSALPMSPTATGPTRSSSAPCRAASSSASSRPSPDGIPRRTPSEPSSPISACWPRPTRRAATRPPEVAGSSLRVD